MSPLVTVLLLAAQPTPDLQQAPPEALSVATDEPQYVSSAQGPSKGRWLLGVELGVSGAEGGALPTLGFVGEYGLHDKLDLRVALRSGLFYTHADLGFGIPLVHQAALSVALRLGASGDFLLAFEGNDEILFAASAGVALTTQRSWGAFSALLDTPMYFGGVEKLWDANAERLFTVGIRPGMVLELGSGSGLAPYFRADVALLVNARGLNGVAGQGAVGLRF
jgi:hypothetical protein